MSAEYDRGFKEGRQYALDNFRLGLPFSYPPQKLHGVYGGGWAEGTRTGSNEIIDRDYPGWKQVSWLHGSTYKVIFKDGRTITV